MVDDDALDFDAWVAARGPALLRLAYTLTGSRTDAEDVVQDALARALPRWHRIARVEHPEAYVRRMVVNAHTSRWRRWRRRETPQAEVLLPGVVEGPDTAIPADEVRAVWAACAALPTDQRLAVGAALLRAAGVQRDRCSHRRRPGHGALTGLAWSGGAADEHGGGRR